MANATVIQTNIGEHVCGMKYHGKEPNFNLCANHSDSCEQKSKRVSMCFKTDKCDICGYCKEHCVGHKAIIGRPETSYAYRV
jgi:MinD superfamily P-loop ATPase